MLPAFAEAADVLGKLVHVAAVQALLLLLVLAGALIARQWHRAPGRGTFTLDNFALDNLLAQGAAGLVGAALLISLTATLACVLLVWGRRRSLRPRAVPGRKVAVTRLAGWPQALLIPAGMLAAALMLRWFPPLPEAVTAPTAWPGIAGLMLVPAFLLLVCERFIAATPADRLPEASRLAALLRIPAATVLALAALGAAAGFGVMLRGWPETLLGVLLLAVAAELALRTVAIWFLPRPAPQDARAAIGSALAALLRPGALRPAELAARMRSQLGIDITRSWAVGYVRAAAPPVFLGLALLAWGLSGLTHIGLAERGAYERFGAPVAILRPGLHLLLPWPFGRVRRVEYGVVHAVPVGLDATGAAAVPTDGATADGAPPASANRLWDQQGGADISYLIASRSGARESFETVSVELRVLYRVGLDDESARRVLYGVAAPDMLVRALSGRLLAEFFADRTLPQVLGARREQVAYQMQRALQAELDARGSGVDVVAVVVESMHPPAGAAVAYRSVQAAQITASAARSDEIGRAHGTLSVARRDAHDVRDQAQADAAELVGAAQTDRTQSDADVLAYRDGGRAFLLERYFANLTAALGRGALEIIDSRLAHPDLPVLDLRGPPPASGP